MSNLSRTPRALRSSCSARSCAAALPFLLATLLAATGAGCDSAETDFGFDEPATPVQGSAAPFDGAPVASLGTPTASGAVVSAGAGFDSADPFGAPSVVLAAGQSEPSGFDAPGAEVFAAAEPAPAASPAPAAGPGAAAPPAAPAAHGAGPRRSNRLARESSPYLLLHAHDPVDWYPWGPEAFAAAKARNKPIFLSVGYSSCYWCHVMARLTFSDPKVAAAMNEKFVNVKVDREERPDVDDLYMTALLIYHKLIGSEQGGGWPLSVFLTPDGKPFAGGTYFPPRDENGRLGFETVIARVDSLWTDKRDEIDKNADLLTRELNRAVKPGLALQKVPLDQALLDSVVRAVAESYDPVHGGLDFDPADADSARFPVPVKLALIQDRARRADDREADKIVRHTLDALAAGGIRDHLAGGFHRYSTDRAWHVPHFEKMLYDQALLASVYLEQYRRFERAADRVVAEEILDFVLKEMTGPEGGFHSALDAETDGIEGAYYLWTPQEIAQALGPDEGTLFAAAYGIAGKPPLEHGFVLRRTAPLDELARGAKTTPEEVERRLQAARRKLLAARERRKMPLKDDKILASWNGLTIRALADSGRLLGRRNHLAAAERAATFLLDALRDRDGRLLRSYRGSAAKLNGYLDDYAFVVDGLLALHEATRERRWLDAAVELSERQVADFRDEQGGGFWFTPKHHEVLVARTRNAHDSVLPSGNGVAVRNLVRLAALTGDPRWMPLAKETLDAFAPQLVKSPRGMAALALGLAEYLEAEKTPGGARPAPRSQPEGSAEAPPRRAANPFDPDVPLDGVVPVEGTDARPEEIRIAVGTPADGPNKPAGPKPVVATKAYLSVDKLPPGGTCRIVVLVDVDPGWHIHSNPPRPEETIPTEFVVKSSVGIRLAQMKYPAGKPIEMPGFDEPVFVYDGQVALYGTLQIPQTAAGRLDEMELILKYQPCDAKRCLKPTTAVLKGSVPVARPGEPVRAINDSLFPKPESAARK